MRKKSDLGRRLGRVAVYARYSSHQQRRLKPANAARRTRSFLSLVDASMTRLAASDADGICTSKAKAIFHAVNEVTSVADEPVDAVVEVQAKDTMH